MSTRRSWISGIAGGAIALRQTGQAGSRPVRLLTITGGHSFDESFWDLLKDRPGWKSERRAHRDSGGATAYDEPVGADITCVLLYDMPKTITAAQQQNLLDLVDRGVGLVVLHHALVALQDWSGFEQLAGLRVREKGEGGLPAFTYKHDVEFELLRVDAKHPVTEGVPSFTVVDETYGKVYYHPDIQPLMVTNHPTSIPIVVWARTYKKSRLVMIQPGHGPQIFANPSFRRLIGNSVEWAGRRT